MATLFAAIDGMYNFATLKHYQTTTKMRKTGIFFLSACMLISFAEAKGDVVGLRTDKALGENLTVAANAGLAATLTWGDGTAEAFVFDGTPQTLRVKSDTLSISTGDALTMLYLPDDGLTSLDVTGARASLRKLFCPQNSLARLNLIYNTVLEELDCQNNRLTTLNVSKCTAMTSLNCANNQLTTLTYAYAPRLTTLICANNQLDTLTGQQRMTKLETLWCEGNKLGYLDLSKTTVLRSLVASSNVLKDIKPGTMADLVDVWVENNQLDSLDLSTASALVSLSADHNKLSRIAWNRACSTTLGYAYLNDNALFFNSFPTVYNTGTGKYAVTCVLAPQEPYALYESVRTNETCDLQSLFTKNGWNIATGGTVDVVDGTGTALVKGTDYNVALGRYTFLTPHESVHFTETCTRYPGVTLTTRPFAVTDATGMSPAEEGEAVRTAKGLLLVRVREASMVTVYGLSGVCFVKGLQQAGERGYSLPSGIYIVNGRKVAIP
jgi:hypothetical protein